MIKNIKIKDPKSTQETLKRTESLLPKRRHEVGTPDICLVIDGDYLAHTAYYSYSKLSFNGASTSLMFGIPTILKALITQHRAKRVIFCWDGKRSKLRMKWLPGYKSHRSEKKPDFLKQKKKVRALLKAMGIAQAHNVNVEGDDMIYKVTKDMQKIYRTIIVTGDKDMMQLINHDVAVYNYRTKVIHTPFAFKADMGIELPQFIDYLILVGDNSDDIPGYPGIGPARASKFLEKFYSIEQYLSNPKAEFAGMADKSRLKDIYRRNKKLMDLTLYDSKFNQKRKIKYYKNNSNPTFNEVRYRQLCIKYNLKSLLSPTILKIFSNL